LEESWRDLFILSLAQWDVPLDMHNILQCAGVKPEEYPTEKVAPLVSDTRYLRDLVYRFKHLDVDRTEYACLKAIALFRPGKTYVC